MTQETTFTTGQASGITGIKLYSVQYYVKTYREYFSPGAAQPKQGRRFIPDDISKLLLIRRMYFEKCSTESIRAALSGQPKTTTQEYTTLDVISLVEAARQYAEAARRDTKEAARQRQEAESILTSAEHVLKKINNMVYSGQAQDIMNRLEKLEKEIRRIKIEKDTQEQQEQEQRIFAKSQRKLPGRR